MKTALIQYLWRVNCTSSNSYTTRCQRGQECCKPLEKNTWQLTYLFVRQLKNMKEAWNNYLVLVFYCTQILTIWWNISNRIQQVLSGDSHIVKPENKSPKSSLHPSCANKTVIDKKRKVWLINTRFDHYQHHSNQFCGHNQLYRCLGICFHLHPWSGL